MVTKEFETILNHFVEKINENIDKDIIIIARKSSDGLAAGSLISSVLLKLDTRITLRLENDLDSDLISRIVIENHDLNIFIDFSFKEISKINNLLKNKFVIINHDIYPKGLKEYDGKIINPYIYGIDGKAEITSCGLTFLLAERIGRGNKRLSMLAIVSALAEKQNTGPKKSLIGLNSEIASIATSIGILNMKADLIFNNLDYKPLHEALAYNISPYIEGITWNKENCYKILKNTGIVTHRNGKFRTFAEISDQEKNMILDAITKFIFLSNPKNEKENDNIENISESFIGYIFEFPNEDRNSILKNGMEFAFALNSCIKYEKIGLGIGICLGERNNTVTEIEKIVFDYKTNIMNSLEKIFREKWRLLDSDSTVFVNGEGILNEGITNDISIILSESISFKSKLLFLRTLSNDNSYNFYVRKGIKYETKKELTSILQEYLKHDYRIEKNLDDDIIVNVPYSKIEEFSSVIRKRISENENTE